MMTCRKVHLGDLVKPEVVEETDEFLHQVWRRIDDKRPIRTKIKLGEINLGIKPQRHERLDNFIFGM